MRIEERHEQPYRAVSRIGAEATEDLADRLSEVAEWIEVRGVEATGTPFFRYHALTANGGRELEVEVAIPVERGSAVPASDEDVTAGMLPAGRYAVHDIEGDPDQLVQGTSALLAWAGEQNLRLDDDGDTWMSRPLEGGRVELSVRVRD